MILLCILVFIFLYLTVAVKLVSLQPYGPKYFSIKTGNTFIFPTVNHKKNSFQPLATLQDWEPAENRKRYT